MRLWKQAVLGLALALFAVLAFARTWPGAAPVLSAIGLPGSLIAIATGAPANKPGGAGGQQLPPKPGQRPVLVEVEKVSSAVINASVAAIGNAEALKSVILVPLASGIVRLMLVKTGETVAAGQVLASLDAEVETIERDRAALSVNSLQEKMARTEQLAKSRAASAVAVNDARLELENARLQLRDAQLKLDRRSIVAPIDGKLGIVPVEIGDYVTTATEIATIDDRSSLRVDFWVPERFAPMISPGMAVEASPLAMPSSRVPGTVEAVASRIEQSSRTLQVRAAIANTNDLLRPGMSFAVTMKFPGETWPSVDPLAIQWSSQGAYVWKVADGKAVRVPVRIVQRNSDAVLVDAELSANDQVITLGVQSLRAGAALQIIGAAQNAAPGGS